MALAPLAAKVGGQPWKILRTASGLAHRWQRLKGRRVRAHGFQLVLLALALT